jgi:hypothetical protein
MSRPYKSSYSQKKSGQDIDTKIVESIDMFSGSALMLLYKFRSEMLRRVQEVVAAIS